MTEYRNTIHLGDFMANGLPDYCCDLIIADPPYYRFKGDFDQVWETFGDYLKDVERWAGFSIAQINKMLDTHMASHWFTYKSQFELPTPEWYGRPCADFEKREGNK